jgi:hypothetical protein
MEKHRCVNFYQVQVTQYIKVFFIKIILSDT